MTICPKVEMHLTELATKKGTEMGMARLDTRWRHSFAKFGLAIIVLALAGCGTVTVDYSQVQTPTPSGTLFFSQAPVVVVTPGTLVPLPTAAPVAQANGNLETDIRAVADRVRPAAVFVGIEANVSNFGRPVPVGNGSGAIIDQQGHILTNNHVVEPAQALKVTLPDGRTFNAQVVGRDPVTDLAVIQIQGSNLPTIPMGDSDKLQVGDWVVAIGNALGLEGGPTVTKGVVSALNRNITEENGVSIPGLIQTDAAINPGNSGGPLVNLNGEIVGINTAVPGPTNQGIQPSGIGFAISINEAKPIIQQLITTGRIIRPYLGVAPVTITPAIAAQLGLPVEKGVVLDSVASNSPAAKAGLQPGDVITAVNGKPISNELDLRQAIQAQKIGDTIQMTVLRNRRQMNVSAQLSQSPSP